MPGWICCQSPEVKLLSLILMSLGLVFCVVFAFLVYMAAEFTQILLGSGMSLECKSSSWPSLPFPFGNATETQDTCLLNSLPKILAWWLHTCVYLLPGSGSFWWRWWTDCLWLTLMRLWVHLLPSKLSRFLCNLIDMIDWVGSSMCYRGAFLAFSLYQMWTKDSAMCYEFCRLFHNPL